MLLGRRFVATAIEPDAAMLGVLPRKWPNVMSTCERADQLPPENTSVDVVVGQAWHGFTTHGLPTKSGGAATRRMAVPGRQRIGRQAALVGAACRIVLGRCRRSAGELRGGRKPLGVVGLAGLPCQLRRFTSPEPNTPADPRAPIATHSAYALMPEDEQRHRLDRLLPSPKPQPTVMGATTSLRRQRSSRSRAM